ncbi:MAG: hypothetical protein WBW02_04005 [Candidatus Sulfotelmatobacter sp.]
MADLVRDAQEEFWSPPSVLDDDSATAAPPAVACAELADACDGCGSEFMIGARFCHTCGLRRRELATATLPRSARVEVIAGLWARRLAWFTNGVSWAAGAWREIPFPNWLHYLHFHEIKRRVGLPTASLIAFLVGLGCVAGVIGVSLFFMASNLVEVQAIKMWRIEWLLAATASFVAGILLKKPSDNE